MFIDWMARLLGRPPEDGGGPELPPGVREERREGRQTLPGRAGSRRDDDGGVFDPRKIAEYDTQNLMPLAPHEVAQFAPLCQKIRAQSQVRAETGLALPHLAQRLIRRIADSVLDVNDLVQLIQLDPIVSANVLRAANSQHYDALGEIRGIRAAVGRLGVEAARQIAVVTVVHAFTESETMSIHRMFGPCWHGLRRHSLATAAGCGWLAMTLRRCDVERAFLAGLLHDIGKFFALRSLSELVISGEVGEPEAPLLETVLEEVHVELGEQLCIKWMLPGFVRAACVNHHPTEEDVAPPEVLMVRTVSGLDEIRTSPYHRPTVVGQVLRSATTLGLTALRMRAVYTRLREAAARADEL